MIATANVPINGPVFLADAFSLPLAQHKGILAYCGKQLADKSLGMEIVDASYKSNRVITTR